MASGPAGPVRMVGRADARTLFDAAFSFEAVIGRLYAFQPLHNSTVEQG